MAASPVGALATLLSTPLHSLNTAVLRCHKLLRVSSSLYRMHTYATRELAVPPDALSKTFSPQHLDQISNRLQLLRRTDLQQHFDRFASVLVALCHMPTGEPAVLFTLRSSAMRAHSGEVSFPGGKRDPEDMSPEACAIRECREEIGIEPERILGLWHDVTNKDNTTCVTPCVGYLGVIDIHTLRPNPDEVSEVFLVPISRLVDPALRSTWVSRRLPAVQMPQFDGGPHRIWGLTAYVLAGVFNTVVFPVL